MRTIHHGRMSKAYLRAICPSIGVAKFTKTFADHRDAKQRRRRKKSSVYRTKKGLAQRNVAEPREKPNINILRLKIAFRNIQQKNVVSRILDDESRKTAREKNVQFTVYITSGICQTCPHFCSFVNRFEIIKNNQKNKET